MVRKGMVLVALLGVAVAGLVIAGERVRAAAAGRTYASVEAIPYRKTGVLLGCSRRLPDGRANLFFAYRVGAAARLFKSGKIDYLIASGDNHVRGYDEATDMKQALTELGVPADRVYCDYAGFRTLDSVVRAKMVFGETSVTFISQEFHNQRAIYIARHAGMDAVGFNARDVMGRHGLRTRLREHLARVRTVLDAWVGTRPRFLGPQIVVAAPTAGG